jgi:hypothetical protein
MARYTDPAEAQLIQPLIEIGKVVAEWNDLHEALGELFGVILYPNEAIPRKAWAVWYSTSNDRSQRQMLKRASEAWFDGDIAKKYPAASEDIKWICDRADALSDARNNAVHAPLTFDRTDPNEAKVVTADFFGHPRAKRLSGKDLSAEFKWIAESAAALKLFAIQIAHALQFPEQWPKRPDLPKRE